MWNFACPLVVYGDNALDYLAQVKGKKVFLVTDKNIVKLGLTKLVMVQLLIFSSAAFDAALPLQR